MRTLFGLFLLAALSVAPTQAQLDAPVEAKRGALAGSRAALYGELFGAGAFASFNGELALAGPVSARVGVALLPELFGSAVHANGLAALHVVPGTGAYRPDVGVGVRLGGADDGVAYPFVYLGARWFSGRSGAMVGLGGAAVISEGSLRGPIPAVSLGIRL